MTRKHKRSINPPITNKELLNVIALETAKMSYPGSMSRGKEQKQVVVGGTREKVENYFADISHLNPLWLNVDEVADNYDESHKRWANELGNFLKTEKCIGNADNNRVTVAAKFIDTFMHQLMKYDRFRPLWKHIHLPLDSQVFEVFPRIDDSSTAIVAILKKIRNRTAYKISYKDYQFIQKELLNFIDELNRRPNAEVRFCSRIELNWLWLKDRGIDNSTP